MRLVESMQIQAGFIPVDMQTAANDGDWISLKHYNHIACVLFKAVGTAGDDPVFAFQQAKTVAGGDAKDLLFTTIYKKLGTQTAIGEFTKVTQTAAASHTDAVSAEAAAIFVVEFDAQDLDVENGFDCIRGRVADVGGAAQLGCLLYLLSEPRVGQATMPSAIVD